MDGHMLYIPYQIMSCEFHLESVSLRTCMEDMSFCPGRSCGGISVVFVL